MIKVLAITEWERGTTNTGDGGTVSQVTKCELNGIIFCVRENTNNISSFEISSGERWGDKIGTGPIRMARQRLELLAPPDKWEQIAKAIYEADPLHRPVGKNSRFTWKWVNELFKSQSPLKIAQKENERLKLLQQPAYLPWQKKFQS